MEKKVSFGQVIIGPPGSGKTTYCKAAFDHLRKLGRQVSVVNIDPANDILPYPCEIDVSELITVSDVMKNMKLGPNGSLIFCMEYLEKNVDWLLEKLKASKSHYFLFDFPGQVELYTHCNSVRNIVQRLVKDDFRLAAVHLVDSHYISDPSKFISVLLTSLSTMIQIELPHINILSKIDLVEKFGKLAFSIDYYTDVLNLDYLLEVLQDDPLSSKFKKMNEAMAGLIEQYGLVSFTPLSISDPSTMERVSKEVDRAGGYMYGLTEEHSVRSVFSSGSEFEWDKIGSIREKYVSGLDEAEEEEEYMT